MKTTITKSFLKKLLHRFDCNVKLDVSLGFNKDKIYTTKCKSINDDIVYIKELKLYQDIDSITHIQIIDEFNNPYLLEIQKLKKMNLPIYIYKKI